MNQTIKLLICLLWISSFICGCAEGTVSTNDPSAESTSVIPPNGEIEQSREEESGKPSESKEQKGLFDGATVREIEIDGGIFRVEQVNKNFSGDDLILLYIKNLTNKDYSVTINGSYLDKNGTPVATETKTFLQFYADYENYFLFHPKIPFDGFAYTLSFETAKRMTFAASDGSIQDIRVTDIDFEFCFLDDKWDAHIQKLAVEKQDHNVYPTVSAYLKYANLTTYAKNIYMDWILYNTRGEIVAIFARRQYVGNTGSLENVEGYSMFPIYQTVEDELDWPEMFSGEIKGIGCVHEVDHYPDEYEHKYNVDWFTQHYAQGTILDLES